MVIVLSGPFGTLDIETEFHISRACYATSISSCSLALQCLPFGSTPCRHLAQSDSIQQVHIHSLMGLELSDMARRVSKSMELVYQKEHVYKHM